MQLIFAEPGVKKNTEKYGKIRKMYGNEQNRAGRMRIIISMLFLSCLRGKLTGKFTGKLPRTETTPQDAVSLLPYGGRG
jgi:hypothetical protein